MHTHIYSHHKPVRTHILICSCAASVHMSIAIYMHTHIYTHYKPVHTHIHVCSCGASAFVRIAMYIYTHVYTHHIHTCIHTHTHICLYGASAWCALGVVYLQSVAACCSVLQRVDTHTSRCGVPAECYRVLQCVAAC